METEKALQIIQKRKAGEISSAHIACLFQHIPTIACIVPFGATTWGV